MIIAVDFDGTLVEHMFPAIGPDVPLAFEYLRKLQEENIPLILWTVRDDRYLDEAIDHCAIRGVDFWGVNANPEQDSWSESPKAFAHFYVDDLAVGCPLVRPEDGRRAYVDWRVVGPFLLDEVVKFRVGIAESQPIIWRRDEAQ